ncbi:MAG: KEOPS complex kinase/ATPase Bud32 [Nanoarchaeota archaeon]
MVEKIIQQGAEASIILDENRIIKRRIKKSYRLDILDERVRKQRTRSEAKLIEKASKVIPVPKLEEVDEKTKEIKMQFLDGQRLSVHLDSLPLTKQEKICKQIGENIAKLHDVEIIHGDLTTSNMILQGSKVYFIDFGLGFISPKVEDKAVDLHVLRQALEAKHFKHWQDLFAQVLAGYAISKNHKKVLEQFKKVETRGRYKEQY